MKESTLIFMWTGLIMLATFLLTRDAKAEVLPEPPVQVVEQKLKLLEAKVYAYTSSVDETDDTPNLTASNTATREGIVANNCLPFGSKVKVGDRILRVEDRMNKRYGCEVFDIWMKSKKEARNFGVQNLIIQIVEN